MNPKPEPDPTPLPRQRQTDHATVPMPVRLRRHDVVRARPAKAHEIDRFGLAPDDWVFEIYRFGSAHPLVYPTSAVLQSPGVDNG